MKFFFKHLPILGLGFAIVLANWLFITGANPIFFWGMGGAGLLLLVIATWMIYKETQKKRKIWLTSFLFLVMASAFAFSQNYWRNLETGPTARHYQSE